jgi:hypothetical protein
MVVPLIDDCLLICIQLLIFSLLLLPFHLIQCPLVFKLILQIPRNKVILISEHSLFLFISPHINHYPSSLLNHSYHLLQSLYSHLSITEMMHNSYTNHIIHTIWP